MTESRRDVLLDHIYWKTYDEIVRKMNKARTSHHTKEITALTAMDQYWANT